MELKGQGTGLSGFTTLSYTHTALSPRIKKMKKQGSPFSFTSFSKMVIKSYLKMRGKDDYRWRFDKMGGGFFSVIRYYEPLVVQLCQLPSFAIAGIQYHSTVISLYNMLFGFKALLVRFDTGMEKIRLLEQDAGTIR